jgi:pyoverdine/dityrosine biosynthesis protein Dit1
MKTLGDTPDRAEEISLAYLNSVAQRINAVYEHGAEVFIYSDMFAFRNFFPKTYSDEKTNAYIDGMNGIIAKNHLDNVTYTRLNMTTEELEAYAESEIAFEARMKAGAAEDEGDLMLYRGLNHFCQPEIDAVYEQLPPAQQPSNSQKKREAKAMAKGIAIMSVAHRKALNEVEPHAIRLSAHPKPVESAQLGAHLDPQHHIGGTPWHNAALREINPMTQEISEVFVKASDARDKGHFECTYPLTGSSESIPKEHRSAAFNQTKVRSSHFESEASLLAQFGLMRGKSFQLCVADKDKERALDLCEQAGAKPTLLVYNA